MQVANIKDKMREARLRWVGHVLRRPIDAPVLRCGTMVSEDVIRGQGRPKIKWKTRVELLLLSLSLLYILTYFSPLLYLL